MNVTLRQKLGTILFAGTVVLTGCSTEHASADSTNAVSAAVPTRDSARTAAAGHDTGAMTDANILAKEAGSDSAEVEIARLAEQRGTSAAVKSYAAMLVADHGKGLRETHALARRLAITPEPPAGDTTAVATSHVQERLQRMPKGAVFDSAFVNHEIDDHEHDIKDAHAMSLAAKHGQVKAFVDASVPELQKHLSRARQIAGHRDGRS